MSNYMQYKIDVITCHNIGKSKFNLDLPMLWQVTA